MRSWLAAVTTGPSIPDLQSLDAGPGVRLEVYPGLACSVGGVVEATEIKLALVARVEARTCSREWDDDEDTGPFPSPSRQCVVVSKGRDSGPWGRARHTRARGLRCQRRETASVFGGNCSSGRHVPDHVYGHPRLVECPGAGRFFPDRRGRVRAAVPTHHPRAPAVVCRESCEPTWPRYGT